MQQYRDKFFLATKTGQRTYREAKDEFHASLQRLQVESVDLIQMHNLTDPDDWRTAMGPGGALEAVVEAQQQGLTRFVGVTGHGVTACAMHMRSLAQFDFDSVLFPLNFMMMRNPQYVADLTMLLSVCRERKVAVQTIKSIARGEWGPKTHTRTVWYEPLEDQSAIDRAVHWVLGNPDVFLITTSDINIMPRVLEAASPFDSRPRDAEMQAMVESMDMGLIFKGREMLFK